MACAVLCACRVQQNVTISQYKLTVLRGRNIVFKGTNTETFDIGKNKTIKFYKIFKKSPLLIHLRKYTVDS